MTLTLRTIALAALPAGALLAQDITGAWQGTLPVKPELRVVVKIAKTGNSGLKAVIYSIDEPGQVPRARSR